MSGTTTNLGLRKPTTHADSFLPQEDIANLANDIDSKVGLAAGSYSLRKLGTGATDAAAGNDSRLPAGADIVAADLADGAVTTPKHADASVTFPKLGAEVLPIGMVMDWAGGSDPNTSWLLCDGRSLLRASYVALFSVIGTTFGAADGTHFNLPDARGRVAVGAGSGSGLTARALGATVGEETHLLTSTEMPSHSHVIPADNNLREGGALGVVDGTDRAARMNGGSVSAGFNMGSTNPSGGGAVHNNMQPSLVLSKVIRAL